MKVLAAEKNVGIEVFLSKFPGIKGKLRTIPQDFTVKEISNYPPEDENGRFSICDVTSVNWETNHLVKELSNQLHISRQRIGFAGTKDKRAKTTQLMSFFKITKEKIALISLKDVQLNNIYRSNRPVKMGNLVGNKFEINIRNISENMGKREIEENISLFKETGFFPNFYGIQRFGIVRPITHIVGKYMVKDDFEKAVMSYVASPIEGESEDVFEIRQKLEKDRDYAFALKRYPNHFSFEKAILNKLIINPNDYVQAIKELPKNLLTMFIYAYQSFIFNKILSRRIKKEIPLDQAIIGDIILPIRKGLIEEEQILVDQNNIAKVNKQIKKGNAVVSGILIGSDISFSKGEMGEIEQKVIEEEKIEPRDFIIPDIPFLSSAGLRRSITTPVNNLEYKIFNEDKVDDRYLTVSFDLLKGSYATCFLREIMKADNITNY